MQHTWSRLAVTYALAPVSAKGRAIAVLFGVALCVVAMGVAPRAGADPPDPPGLQYQAFYTPPDPLPPGRPGDLIRTEPSRLVLEPSGSWVPTWPAVLGSCTAAPTPAATRSR